MPGLWERLSVTLRATPGGSLILDATALVIAEASSCSTNTHGYATASIALDVAYSRAMWLRAQLLGAWLTISDGVAVRWEGRVEDLRVEGDRLTLTAYGAQRAFSDLPYTALWSSTSTADWTMMTPDDLSVVAPERWQSDTNNRLYLAPRKNEKFSLSSRAGIVVKAPSGGGRQIVACSFSYEFLAPSGWQGRLDVTGVGAVWTLSGTGAVQSGTQTLTFSASDNIYFLMFYNNATETVFAGETGSAYFKLTNVRVKTTTATSVTADLIASHIVASVSAVNPDHLSSSTALIQSPGLDLQNEVYEDADMADILSYLVALGDTQTPPRQWEWAVWEDRVLVLRPRGSAGRTWYVNVPNPTVEDTLDTLINSVTPVLKTANGDRVVGTTVSDAGSIARYNLTRREALVMDTTSATEATSRANARLADRKTPLPHVQIPVTEIRDANGGARPLYELASGDTVILSNLPVNLSTDVDRLRIFRVAETEYRLDGTAAITPELPLPSLEVLLGRHAAGVDAPRPVWLHRASGIGR